MFSFKKKKLSTESQGLMQRLRHGLDKTRAVLFTDLDDLFNSRTTIDEVFLEEIETRLLMADLGVEATSVIIDKLSSSLKKNELGDMKQLIAALRGQMLQILEPVQQQINLQATKKKPFVILVVGVNGAGKTTTIGKLCNHYIKHGQSVMLAAGDTFRAAAIEQIQAWGKMTNAPVIAQQSGSDSAAVIYDALQSARSKGTDIVIADTAGRLHNKDNLMEELRKIRRIITKFDPDITTEIMLVLDAGTGQNAISQTKQFNEVIGITGITLTKLDGTAKGGVVFALAQALATPIRFIGVGEQVEDLRPFNTESFIDALLNIGTD